MEQLLKFPCFMCSVVGQALPHEVLVGVLHSSINLTTQFDQFDVKEITWTLEKQGKKHQIVKFQNGHLVHTDGIRYKLFYNGTILGIDNLTINDSGLYTADATFWNNEMSEEGFNITVHGQALHYKVLVGVLHSSINLTTHFNPFDMKEITWTLEKQKNEYQIVKIQNGELVHTDRMKYILFKNGIILGIDNLTRNDSGLYTADVTFWNNTISGEGFNITVYEDVKTDSAVIPIKVLVVVAVTVLVVVLVVMLCWKYWESIKQNLRRALYTEVKFSEELERM